MQVPIRKSEQHNKRTKLDPYMTEEKFVELKNKLARLKNFRRPQEAAEVKRLAEMGDFSENTGYQLAKGRLRGINQRIIELEEHLNRAEIIKPTKNTETVALGSRVTVKNASREKTYLVLGSAETDPAAGIISHNSPLGAALIGRHTGDKIKIQLADKETEFEIIKIE
ncbi:MAG: transcription elongation factor GreA [Patescibacteria group bacterium]